MTLNWSNCRGLSAATITAAPAAAAAAAAAAVATFSRYLYTSFLLFFSCFEIQWKKLRGRMTA